MGVIHVEDSIAIIRDCVFFNIKSVDGSILNLLRIKQLLYFENNQVIMCKNNNGHAFLIIDSKNILLMNNSFDHIYQDLLRAINSQIIIKKINIILLIILNLLLRRTQDE